MTTMRRGADGRAIGLVTLLLATAGHGCRQGAKETPAARPGRTATAAQEATKGTARLPRPLPAFARAGAREGGLSDIAEGAVRSVVNVRTSKALPPGRPLHGHRFFGPQPGRRQAHNLGSGVIVSAEGVVLTNHHVVDRASAIELTLADGSAVQAEVAGSDPKSDVAVLRIKDPPKDLVPLPLGDSNALRLGEVVLAIGNPFGVGQTVTMGIVSAKGRAQVGIVDYEDFIQTDAAINPGNSGGALVNMRGELVGINTAILSKTGGSQGIGLAIPTMMARPIMESLLEHGRVRRGWLGVVIQDLRKELAEVMKLPVRRGVLVADVQEGSPAAAAGLRRGDVIVALDGQAVASVARLRNTIANKGPGVEARIKLYRDGKPLDLGLTLAELPDGRRASLQPSHGALGGLTVETLDERSRRQLGLSPHSLGVVIKVIEPGSAAAGAGLQLGDVIMELNRGRVRNSAEFARRYREASGTLLLLVVREGSAMYLLMDK
jgi:serine protease Do